MFLGHFALGFGAKAVAPQVSLGSLFLSVQFVDLLWPTLLLMGVEHVRIVPGITEVTPLDFVHYPISHSLLMMTVWGLLFAAVYWLAQRNTAGAILLGIGVVSHWFLDLIVHRPDLPLHPGDSPELGLGLWHSTAGTLVVEGALFAAGVLVYRRVTKARNRAGAIGFWVLVALFVLIYLANVLGPPPPSVEAIAWAGQLQWLFIIWAYWLDRNREARHGR